MKKASLELAFFMGTRFYWFMSLIVIGINEKIGP